jgi:type VI secretion system secreted protein Hcp
MPVYLKYGDKIKGEVKEPAHRGWIELTSAQFGSVRRSRPLDGREGRDGSSNATEITVTKKSDSTSVHLFREGLSGKEVVAVIDFAKPDGSVYLRVEMTGTLISSYNLSESGKNPTESLTLSFTKVEITNIPGTPATNYDETY